MCGGLSTQLKSRVEQLGSSSGSYNLKVAGSIPTPAPNLFMSDLMYNEVEGYQPNDTWKLIAVHDDKYIKGFFGPYRFLSNFYPAITYFEGARFPASENAYQAAKTLDRNAREAFREMTPYEAKKEGMKLTLRKDWDHVRVRIMRDVVTNKFDGNKILFKQLLDTGDKYLEELNWWKDEYWGVDVNSKTGLNMLGEVLMNLRDLRNPKIT